MQGTTREPPTGSSAGDFFNTLTGDIFGTDIDFLVAHYQRGRFYVERDEKTGKRKDDARTFTAGPEDIVPNYWPEAYAGLVFTELPEAEERYKELVNDEQIEWGNGPPIETTYNFTGLVVRSDLEDALPVPLRLSLRRTGTPAAKSILGMLKPLRNYWDRAIHLESERKVGNQGPYFVVKAREFGPAPENAQRAAAIELALAGQQIGLKDAEADDAPAAAKPKADESGEGPSF